MSALRRGRGSAVVATVDRFYAERANTATGSKPIHINIRFDLHSLSKLEVSVITAPPGEP
jgi:hypothetical protein